MSSKTRFKAVIIKLAQEHGYALEQEQANLGLLVFVKGPALQINVYTTTGTVVTCLNHPKWGKTQLFRRNVTIEALGRIFRDPRAHTGKGYYGRYSVQLDKRMSARSHAFNGICWCWPDVTDEGIVKHRTIGGET